MRDDSNEMTDLHENRREGGRHWMVSHVDSLILKQRQIVNWKWPLKKP